jgi:hypothetical protein
MNDQQFTILYNLIIAHLLSDFVFQSKKMVENKKWFSKEMFLHVGIVYILSAFFSFLWWQAIIITLIHYLIDGVKIELKKKYSTQEIYWFLLDQFLHLSTIVIVCLLQFGLSNQIFTQLNHVTQNNINIVILLAYILITFPTGYLIGIMTKNISNEYSKETKKEQDQKANNGLRIGIFERIIILTFVILGQYEAIGFLITGKSLLRFASKDESLKSEYVLLGTMMSYAITIIIGVLLNLYLKMNLL